MFQHCYAPISKDVHSVKLEHSTWYILIATNFDLGTEKNVRLFLKDHIFIPPDWIWKLKTIPDKAAKCLPEKPLYLFSSIWDISKLKNGACNLRTSSLDQKKTR